MNLGLVSMVLYPSNKRIDYDLTEVVFQVQRLTNAAIPAIHDTSMHAA